MSFWCHVAEGALASFGGMMVAGQAVFSVLATSLGATPVGLGLLISLGRLSVVATFLAAPAVEATRRKKRLVLLLGVGQRLPLLLSAAALVVLGSHHPMASLVVLAVLTLCRNVAGALVGPAWLDLIAETIPTGRLARVFGFRQGASATLGLVAGPACAAIIAGIALPYNYALLYLIGFAAMLVSWCLFAMVDEVPGDRPRREATSPWAYFRELLPALRRDVPFRWYLLFRACVRTSAAVRPFYWAAHVSAVGVEPGFVAGAFLVASSVAKIVGNTVYPFLGERLGHKTVLGIGVTLRACGAALAAAAPSNAGFVAVYLLDGLAVAANQSCNSPFMISLTPRDRRVGYATLLSVALAPVGIVMLPAAGLAVQGLGHAVLFGATAALLVSSLALLARAHPRPGSAEQEED